MKNRRFPVIGLLAGIILIMGAVLLLRGRPSAPEDARLVVHCGAGLRSVRS